MRRLRLALVALLVGTLLLVPGTAIAAPPATGALSEPVTGSDTLGNTFDGTFTVTRFRVVDGAIRAVGTLTGTVSDAGGIVLGTVTRQVALPVVITQATCEILELTLGPLDLNLLGLMIHLDEVHLEITAQQGPGNLLGNLLCAIVGLLDPGTGSALNAIVALLNQILAILQGL